ncbi:MAG: hypothetical protein FWC73_03385 [Defluviitaleaceae bacterium]|nr:hypothetical protein [Defluviitaleaceae bacterium]
METKDKYYQRILEGFSDWDFIKPSNEIVSAMKGSIDETFLSVTARVTAPVLVSYIIWVLQDANARGIDTLLFVARDGFVMYKIAKILCEAWGIDITCKYFYASRFSLRLPMYGVDKGYALDKLCDPDAGNTTLQAVLVAAGLSPEQAACISKEICINLSDKLSKDQLKSLKVVLSGNQRFNELALNSANMALEAARRYFAQEVPSHPKNFAIVDSGWAGSIQGSFGKLYQHFTRHSSAKINGYYFGMIKSPPRDTGIYKCFYFSHNTGFSRFRNFCIDLFECLCAAGHGKVLGYDNENESQWMMPVLDNNIASYCDIWDAQTQIMLCEKYAKGFAEHNPWPNKNDSIKMVQKLLRAFMQNPSKNEAKVYGAIPFSRGVLEGDIGTLARTLTPQELRHYTFSNRIKTKFSQSSVDEAQPIFWIPGAIALSKVSFVKKFDVKMLLATYWLKVRMTSRG